MIGKTKQCYLVVWFDPADQMLKHEVIPYDNEQMHHYANQRRAELATAVQHYPVDPEQGTPMEEANLVAVFDVKEPKRLEGNLELVFREGQGG
jgi:hypothetical protein